MDVQHPIRKVLPLAALSSVLVFCAAIFAQAQQPILRAPDSSEPQLLPSMENDAPAEPQTFSTEPQTPTFEPEQPAAEPEQPLVQPEQPAVEPEQSIVEPQQPSAGPYCPTCASSDFWIVSSRHCCKDSGPCFTTCPLQYFHVGSDGARRPVQQQQFVDSLEPGIPVCIVVHGSFASWKDVCEGSRDLYNWLHPSDLTQRVQFVFYTWPSESPNTTLLQIDFGVLARRSADHGFHLARLISAIPPDRPLSLIGHSHGARLISSALHMRAGGEVQGMRPGCAPDLGRRIRVVFAAAAIDSHWLNPGERYGLALNGVEFLLNLTSRHDRALTWYPFRRLFSNEALGITGFTPRNRQAMGQWVYKIADMDVTPLVKTHHFWQHYVRQPQIAYAIAPTVFYQDAPSQQPAEAAPSQAVQSTSAMTIVPQKRTRPESMVRETYSHIRRTRPAGRM